MFGLRLTTKRELMAYAKQMAEYREEINRLRKELERWQDRFSKVVNLLLAKNTGMAIKLDEPMTIAEEEELKTKAFDIFNEGSQMTEEEVLDELQR